MYPKRDTSFQLGDPAAPIQVVIFHGYTASTDEFENLAQRIVDEMHAHVSVPLLPGHGTNEAELLHLEYEDFRRFAINEVERAHKQETRLVILGHSFGGYLAMECAAQYRADALVLTVVPFVLRFPLNIPGLAWLMKQKLLWDKKLPLQEKIERIGLFYYNHMPGIALTLLKEGVRRSEKALRTIGCPILVMNTSQDPLAHESSAQSILDRSQGNAESRIALVPREDHGLFYGVDHEKHVEQIVSFLKQVCT